jgi:hypothetical protein
MGTSFIFYPSFLEALEGMPDDSYIRLTRCIHAYGTTGEETELQGLERNIFVTIKAQIDANTKKRSDGMKGGRPRKSKGKTAKTDAPEEWPDGETENAGSGYAEEKAMYYRRKRRF